MSTTFGENIRKYREQKGMRQEDLALALGYKTKGSVNKIENNVTKLPQNKIALCAKVLGIPVAQLFSDAVPVRNQFEEFQEYIPYLAQASEETIRNIRFMLGMPITEKKSDGNYIAVRSS